MKRAILSLIAVGLCLGLLARDKFIDSKSFSEWKKGDVMKLLNDSPWAKQQTYAYQIAGKGSGVGGEKELFNQYTIRFFSALPVRHAYLRMMQMMNNYDSMGADQKLAFDQKMSSSPLMVGFGDEIIVAGEFATNNRQHQMDADRRLKQVTASEFKQSVYLISDRLGQIQIKGYFPPSPDGSGFKFVFPRTVDGKPVIAPEDKEVTFRWWFDNEIVLTFKVKDMMYNGKVEF